MWYNDSMNSNDLARQNNLTDNEVAVLEAILQRMNNGVYKIPIREVAKAAFVSTTSVVRLAKKMGYDGYSEMLYELKLQCTSAVEYHVSDMTLSVLTTESSLSIVDELIHDLVSSAYHRVHVMGIGYSDYAAAYFRDKLLEMDYFCTTKSPLDFECDLPSLVIFISESGETSDLIAIEERLKLKNYKMYALSSNENSTLCKKTKRNIIIKKGRKTKNKFPNYFIGNSMNLIESILAILQANRRR